MCAVFPTLRKVLSATNEMGVGFCPSLQPPNEARFAHALAVSTIASARFIEKRPALSHLAVDGTFERRHTFQLSDRQLNILCSKFPCKSSLISCLLLLATFSWAIDSWIYIVFEVSMQIVLDFVSSFISMVDILISCVKSTSPLSVRENPKTAQCAFHTRRTHRYGGCNQDYQFQWSLDGFKSWALHGSRTIARGELTM